MAKFERVLTVKHIDGLRREIAERPNGLIADLLRLWQPSGVPSMGNFGLRLAIRKNYLNLYQFGQSMARVSFDRRCNPVVSIHPKYVLKHDKREANWDFSSIYVSVQEDKISGAQPCLPDRYLGHEMLIDWMRSAKTYAGAEKKFVDRLVGFNPSVIDLEMGLPASPGERSAPRMDIVALEEVGDRIQIVFWEAKCMHNPELRAAAEPDTPGGAAIFNQIERYRAWVSEGERKRAICDAYANAARIMVELKKLIERLDDTVLPIGDLVHRAATLPQGLLLDDWPRLVIEDGPKRKSFRIHKDRLENKGHHLQIVTEDDPRPLLRGKA